MAISSNCHSRCLFCWYRRNCNHHRHAGAETLKLPQVQVEATHDREPRGVHDARDLGPHVSRASGKGWASGGLQKPSKTSKSSLIQAIPWGRASPRRVFYLQVVAKAKATLLINAERAILPTKAGRTSMHRGRGQCEGEKSGLRAVRQHVSTGSLGLAASKREVEASLQSCC